MLVPDDTIAAISTPIGEGGIGIVRASGPHAIAIAEKIFFSPAGIRLAAVASHTLHYGFIVDGNQRIDEVLVAVMRAPRTYTREDIVEINCHSGIVPLRWILNLLLKYGARLAEPGEFTKRAFLNGRINLNQVKAVLDVVKAKTELGLETAISHLTGRFSALIASVKDELSRLLAQIEVEIDFPDADIEPGSQQELLNSLIRLHNRIKEMIARGKEGKILRQGLAIVILGKTNVGKSTLFNALLQEERAIVTPIPGTTRDTLEETIAIDGIPFRLIDTAGLRCSDDVVEQAGIERTKRAKEIADLILFVIDRSLPITADDQHLAADLTGKRVILLQNKSDLPAATNNIELDGKWEKVYAISAQNGTGLTALKKGIIDLCFSGAIPERSGILLLNTWEEDLLRHAARAISRAIEGLQTGYSIDMISEEIRTAYLASTQLQGIDATEELLDRIFADFCIGK